MSLRDSIRKRGKFLGVNGDHRIGSANVGKEFQRVVGWVLYCLILPWSTRGQSSFDQVNKTIRQITISGMVIIIHGFAGSSGITIVWGPAENQRPAFVRETLILAD